MDKITLDKGILPDNLQYIVHHRVETIKTGEPITHWHIEVGLKHPNFRHFNIVAHIQEHPPTREQIIEAARGYLVGARAMLEKVGSYITGVEEQMNDKQT